MAYDSTTFWSRADKYLMTTGAPFSPTIISKAQGTLLYDVDGKVMLDFTSGQMSSLLGHSHPEIVDVVRTHIGKLDHLMSLMVSEPVVDLAEDLARILPAPLEKSFFLCTGSESVEAAIKMAKYASGKFEIVAFSQAYHGSTQGAASSTYALGRKHGGPLMPGSLTFPAPYEYRSVFRKSDGSYDWEAEMEFGWSMIDQQSVGSLAAFVFEPILSAGGILVPPPGYLKRLSIECKNRNMLLIADEAQTGLGRTGDMFAFQSDDIVPDILTLSKTIGCGLPLASVSTTAEIAKKAQQAGFLFITTHYNDPLIAAVGSKVIEIVVRDDICKRAKERGEQLRDGLERLRDKYRCIGDVRGRGLMQGMEIVLDPVTKTPGVELGLAISQKVLQLGLSSQIVAIPGACGVFRMAPPVTVSAVEIEQGLAILEQAFDSVCPEYAYESYVGGKTTVIAEARL